MNEHAKEREIPIALIAIGVVLYVIAGYRIAGDRGVAAVFLFLTIGAGVGVALMLVAAFITAAITKQSFGDLRSGILKLSAIYLFPSAVGAMMPAGLGALISLAIFFSLIIWLFELDMVYAVVFSLVLFAVEFSVGLILAKMTE